MKAVKAQGHGNQPRQGQQPEFRRHPGKDLPKIPPESEFPCPISLPIIVVPIERHQGRGGGGSDPFCDSMMPDASFYDDVSDFSFFPF